MTRYRLISIMICLMLFKYAAAQEPYYVYWFKLLDANGQSITDADSVYSISSIKPDGSFYKGIKYLNFNSGTSKAPSKNWMLYEYYRDIREFNLIQILNKQSRDTMTLFYKKEAKRRTYLNVDNWSFLDTIRFSKGYYIVHKKPSLKDWDMIGKSQKLRKLPGRTDFLTYVTMETDVEKNINPKDLLYAGPRKRIESSEPVDLSRFTNLAFPVHKGEQTGQIVVRFSVDKDGRVTDAVPAAPGTTLDDKNLNQKCKEAMMKSRLIQSDRVIQSGTVIFYFKSKQSFPPLR